MTNRGKLVVDALGVSPAVAITSTHIAGVNWPDIVYILTAIHLVILIVKHLISKKTDDE